MSFTTMTHSRADDRVTNVELEVSNVAVVAVVEEVDHKPVVDLDVVLDVVAVATNLEDHNAVDAVAEVIIKMNTISLKRCWIS